MANLEIIDMLCEINSSLASLVSRMANIADEVQKSIFQEKEHCEEMMDLAEYKMRRIIGHE